MNSPGESPLILRIFISSPGDAAEEREKTRQVVAQLQKWYGEAVHLIPVLWEDLPLKTEGSFQEGIDVILSDQEGIDIAVFILWSRLGTALAGITKPDGSLYRSGTEREFDLMLRALEASGGKRPDILYYKRSDDDTFNTRLSAADDEEKLEMIQQKESANAFVQEYFWNEEGNIRAYHSFQQPVEFAGRLKVHLRALIDQKIEDGDRQLQARWTDSPYRGLETFNLEHSDIFFGREAEICDLENRLRQRASAQNPCAFAAVIGASGSGKSSLAQAGLGASLTRFNLDESVREWRSVAMIPGQSNGEPLRGLIRAMLAEPGALPELDQLGLTEQELVDSFVESPATATRTVAKPALTRAAESAEGPVKLLVIVDQFEELFTDKRISENEQSSFLLALESLAQSGLCWVVVTMRSDLYSVAQKSEIFLRLKGENGQFDLLPPGPEALRRIITEPARMAGIRFEKRADDLGGASLVGAILEDAQNQPDMLPLLSDLLLELYHHRTPENVIPFEAYESLGDQNRTGLEGALSQRAEKEFAKLTPKQQAICPEIFHALVTVESNADVRRRASLDSVRDSPEKSALVDAFIAARLLTADGDAEKGESTVSLAHEALLRKWDRVSDWVAENRQFLRIRTRVEQAQRRWQERDRDASLLLPEGLQLEEGLSLAREAPHLLIGSDYDATREFIDRSRRKQRSRKRRTSLLRGAVAAVLLAISGLAMLQRNEAQENAEKARIHAGSFWMQLSENAPTPVESALYAGVATGFTGADGGHADPNFPAFLTPENSSEKWKKARTRIAESPRPFFWASPSSWDNPYDDDPEVQRQKMSALPGHADWVRSVAFSPDGRTLASGEANIILWDTLSGEKITTLPGSHQAYHLEFSPDGRILAASSSTSWGSALKTTLWDLATKTEIATLEGGLAHFSPDGGFLFTNLGTEVKLWTGAGRNEKAAFATEGDISSIDLSPDGALLAALSNDTVTIWKVTGGELYRELKLESPADSLAFHPKGGLLVDGLNIWDFEHQKLVGRRDGDKTDTYATSPSGGILAQADYELVKFWEGPSFRSERTLSGHSMMSDRDGEAPGIFGVTFSPGGKLVATVGSDRTVQMWEVPRSRRDRDETDSSKPYDWMQYVRNGWVDVLEEGCEWHAKPEGLPLDDRNIPPDSWVDILRNSDGAEQTRKLFQSALEAKNWETALILRGQLVAEPEIKSEAMQNLASFVRGSLLMGQIDLAKFRVRQGEKLFGQAWFEQGGLGSAANERMDLATLKDFLQLWEGRDPWSNLDVRGLTNIIRVGMNFGDEFPQAEKALAKLLSQLDETQLKEARREINSAASMRVAGDNPGFRVAAKLLMIASEFPPANTDDTDFLYDEAGRAGALTLRGDLDTVKTLLSTYRDKSLHERPWAESLKSELEYLSRAAGDFSPEDRPKINHHIQEIVRHVDYSILANGSLEELSPIELAKLIATGSILDLNMVRSGQSEFDRRVTDLGNEERSSLLRDMMGLAHNYGVPGDRYATGRFLDNEAALHYLDLANGLVSNNSDIPAPEKTQVLSYIASRRALNFVILGQMDQARTVLAKHPDHQEWEVDSRLMEGIDKFIGLIPPGLETRLQEYDRILNSPPVPEPPVEN